MLFYWTRNFMVYGLCLDLKGSWRVGHSYCSCTRQRTGCRSTPSSCTCPSAASLISVSNLRRLQPYRVILHLNCYGIGLLVFASIIECLIGHVYCRKMHCLLKPIIVYFSASRSCLTTIQLLTNLVLPVCNCIASYLSSLQNFCSMRTTLLTLLAMLHLPLPLGSKKYLTCVNGMIIFCVSQVVVLVQISCAFYHALQHVFKSRMQKISKKQLPFDLRMDLVFFSTWKWLKYLSQMPTIIVLCSSCTEGNPRWNWQVDWKDKANISSSNSSQHILSTWYLSPGHNLPLLFSRKKKKNGDYCHCF
jgi:hypothetical protein